MGLKVRLECYDKKTEIGQYTEYSKDFGDNGDIINAVGLPVENNVNNGEFDVEPWWVPILQPHFKHVIEVDKYDYQIGFDYCDDWEAWHKEND